MVSLSFVSESLDRSLVDAAGATRSLPLLTILTPEPKHRPSTTTTSLVSLALAVESIDWVQSEGLPKVLAHSMHPSPRSTPSSCPPKLSRHQLQLQPSFEFGGCSVRVPPGSKRLSPYTAAQSIQSLTKSNCGGRSQSIEESDAAVGRDSASSVAAHFFDLTTPNPSPPLSSEPDGRRPR